MSPARALGTILRNLRKGRGLTGAQLGAHVGLSQSKISKLEQGYPPLPDPDTLMQLLETLQASKSIRREVQLLLLQLGSAPHAPNYYAASYLSGRYIGFERSASLIQVVTYNLIPALLQTVAYREAFLKAVGTEDTEIESIMRESFQRQDLLWDKVSTYEFLIHEAALYSMPATVRDQLAQLDKLDRFIGLSNIEIGIIPTTAGLPMLEPCNFVMYDKQHVLRSAGIVELESQDRETALQYVQFYEELSLKACFGRDSAQLIAKASHYIAQNLG